MAEQLATGGQHEVLIDAPPEAVWALVSDVDRIDEWSPEVYKTERVSPGPIQAGSVFRGYNRRVDGLKSWWSDCEVLEFEPSLRFAFKVLRADFGDDRGTIEFPEDLRTTWRYAVSGSDDSEASTLRVSFDCRALADPESAYRKNDRFEAIDSGAEETLQRIKEAAEGSSA